MMSIPGTSTADTPPVQLRIDRQSRWQTTPNSADGRWVTYASYHGGSIYIGVALIPGRGWHTRIPARG